MRRRTSRSGTARSSCAASSASHDSRPPRRCATSPIPSTTAWAVSAPPTKPSGSPTCSTVASARTPGTSRPRLPRRRRAFHGRTRPRRDRVGRYHPRRGRARGRRSRDRGTAVQRRRSHARSQRRGPKGRDRGRSGRRHALRRRQPARLVARQRVRVRGAHRHQQGRGVNRGRGAIVAAGARVITIAARNAGHIRFSSGSGPTTVAAAAIDLGGVLNRYVRGNISPDELRDESVNILAGAAFSTYCGIAGQNLIPVPFAGALIGSLVGTAVSGLVLEAERSGPARRSRPPCPGRRSRSRLHPRHGRTRSPPQPHDRARRRAQTGPGDLLPLLDVTSAPSSSATRGRQPWRSPRWAPPSIATSPSPRARTSTPSRPKLGNARDLGGGSAAPPAITVAKRRATPAAVGGRARRSGLPA